MAISKVLLESGDDLLLESGDFLLLELSVAVSFASAGTAVDVDGAVLTSSVAYDFAGAVGDVFLNGTRHTSEGVMYVTTDVPTGTNQFINGILHTESGIRYVETSGGVNTWPEGFAVADDGTQLITTSLSSPSSIRGIARDSDGAMST